MDEDEEDVLTLHRRIREHPATVAHGRRVAVLRTQYMLIENAQHLMSWIDAFDGDQGFILMSEDQEEAREQYNDELCRRWHNYAASAMTLVSHHRTLMKAQTVEFKTRVAAKRTELLDVPVVPFTQGLRNFMLHRWWPKSFLRMTFNNEGTTLYIGCRTSDLLSGWDWTVEQRRYLQEAGEEFLMRDSVTSYMDVLDCFYDWFWDAYTEEYARDRADLHPLYDKYGMFWPDRDDLPPTPW